MKGKYYLTDYLIEKNIKIERGFINLLNAPAGSGKTSFIFGNKEQDSRLKSSGLLYATDKFLNYDGGNPFTKNSIKKGHIFAENLSKVIYLCDTKMLKAKILDKYSNITKEFKENDKCTFFKKAKEDNKSGKITVMTYKQFAWMMSDKSMISFVLNNIECIIMDEFHNLFDYNSMFTKDEYNYENITKYLASLATYCTVVAMTATDYLVDKNINNMSEWTRELYRKLIKDDTEIIQYENHTTYVMLQPINMIKTYCKQRNIIKSIDDNKILVFANKIKTCEKYKEMFLKAGFNAENLCTLSRCNTKQEALREYLIKNEKMPNDLDVLIINRAYETGWDLKDERVKHIIIDSYNPTIITQVRNRCRHDISELTYKLKKPFNIPMEYRTEFDICKSYICINRSDKKLRGFSDKNYTCKFEIEDKYLGCKLTKEIKYELVNMYANADDEGKINWQTFKCDLIDNGYYLKKINNSYYIFKDGEEIIKDTKKEIKKMNNDNRVIYIKDYLKDIMGLLLDETDRNKLIEELNFKENRRLIRGMNGINQKLEESKIDYMIIPERTKDKRFWKVIAI